MMLPHHSDKAIWFVIFLNFLLIILVFGISQFQINNLKSLPTSTPQIVYTTLAPTIIPTIQPTPTPIVKFIPSPTKSASSITYIPLTGGTTTNTDWTNINASQFNLNIGDYGTNASAVWDANLRVDNANGTTFARIFDLTHSIAVNGSEISVDSTSNSTNVVSGNLSFWSGNNTYVIQVKSLNGSTAFFDSGRVKIVY